MGVQNTTSTKQVQERIYDFHEIHAIYFNMARVIQTLGKERNIGENGMRELKRLIRHQRYSKICSHNIQQVL